MCAFVPSVAGTLLGLASASRGAPKYAAFLGTAVGPGTVAQGCAFTGLPQHARLGASDGGFPAWLETYNVVQRPDDSSGR
jgi:hypothetical protein